MKRLSNSIEVFINDRVMVHWFDRDGISIGGSGACRDYALASMHQVVSCSIRRICVDALFKAQNT